MQVILKGDVLHPITFKMIATDHVTSLVGASPSVVISKNGGSFAAPAGKVSEVGHGVYALAPAAVDVSQTGMLELYATAAGADPTNCTCQVISFGSNADPYTVRFGSTRSGPTPIVPGQDN